MPLSSPLFLILAPGGDNLSSGGFGGGGGIVVLARFFKVVGDDCVQSSSALETSMVDKCHRLELNDDKMLSLLSCPEPAVPPMILKSETPMTWMGRHDAKPKKGIEARIPFLWLATVVTACYLFEPMG
jgi:hypothetical protein